MNKDRNHSMRERLLQLGERGAPRPSLMKTNRQAWWVDSGSVDVFLVSAGEGAMAGGARDYLFSVDAGQLLLFPAIPAGSDEALAAVPGPDTHYRTIARQDLLAALEQAAWRDTALELLDALAGHVAAGFKEKTPAASMALTCGMHYASTEQAVAVTAQAPGMWLGLATGHASYMGRHALPSTQAVPLPPSAWITLAPDSSIATWSTREAWARGGGDAILNGMETLLLALLQVASWQRRQHEADELNRLQLRTAIGSKAMHDALGGFVSLFEPRPFDLPDGGDRLLNACKIIGARQGIAFTAAPEPGQGAGRRDPVRDIAQASAVRTRQVALKGAWWRNDNGPLLAFLDSERAPFALLPVRGGYQAIDPDTGQRQTVDAAFAETLAPFAYMFYAGLPAKKLALADIMRFMSLGIGPDIRTVLAIGLASALLGMAIPLASGHLFDHVFPAAEHGRMVQLVCILFIASLVTLLFEATRALAMLRIEGKAGSDLQAAIWDRVLALPVPFFRGYAAGDLATRINGINDIRQALSGTVISSLINSVFSVLNVFLLFYYSVPLALAALLLVGVAVGANLAIGYATARVARQSADVNGRVAGLVLEYLSGITKLRITGSESRAFANWAAGFAAQKRLALRAGSLANVSGVFSAAFPLAANAALFACIALGSAQADTARFSTGDFIAFSAAWTVFLGSTLSLVRTGINLLSIASTYERTRPILETLPEVDQSMPKPGTLSGAIELSNVSFSYAPESPVLDDISMSIKAGEFVALVGASGCGKSTLLRLLLGFERATQGGIYYDEHHLAEIDVGALRRQLGVVLQGGRLMSGDILTNILGATSLTLNDAWEAARACGLEDDINAMPMGMHSVIGDGDGTLSGGQRQRLLIARAIVNKPRIIFFDEATSALDNRSQAIVSASMERLQATRIVIAHRLSTILNADRIYVLDKGKIVQCGSYQQLIGQDGLFAELAKRQMA